MAFSLAVAIGATIGAGILRMPGEVAAHLPSKGFFIAAWILGGINALLGATVFAELGAMMPRSGGLYNFARRAFGDYGGFLVGYSDWLNQTVSVSLLALVVGEYSRGLWPGLEGEASHLGLFILLAIAAVQWTGIRSGSRIQELTTLLKTAALLGLIVSCFLSNPHRVISQPQAAAVPSGLSLVFAFILAMQAILFAYDSYFYVVYYGEELRNPGKEIPRSMFMSVCLIIFIYVLINLAFLRVLPIQQMAKDPFVAATVAKAIFGERGELILRVTLIVSILGTMNATVLSSTRVLYGLGRDKLFLHQATRVNAGGTPTVSLALSTLASCAFLITGTFDEVLAAGALFLAVNYFLSYAALITLRWREPNTARPYRAWGYPWTTAIVIILILVFFVGRVVSDTKHSLVTIAVLVVTAPLFYGWKRFATVRPGLR